MKYRVTRGVITVSTAESWKVSTITFGMMWIWVSGAGWRFSYECSEDVHYYEER